MNRREYKVQIVINNRRINKVIIDPHFEFKHSKSIKDDIILKLVRLLHKGVFPAESVNPPYSYHVTDNLVLNGKRYKLIWLLEDHKLYIGVVNAYRRR